MARGLSRLCLRLEQLDFRVAVHAPCGLFLHTLAAQGPPLLRLNLHSRRAEVAMGTDVLAQLGELTTLQQLRLRVVSSSLGIVAPLANLKQLEELLVSCKLVLDAPNANVQGLQAVLLACPRLRHLQLACRSVQEPRWPCKSSACQVHPARRACTPRCCPVAWT